MNKKIVPLILACVALFAMTFLLVGCGEKALSSPTHLDIKEIEQTLESGEKTVCDAFVWDKVYGADGYLIYFNDNLTDRFFITENYLPISEAEISNYLKSGTVNSVNIRAVKLDKKSAPTNASKRSVILFNYSKKLQGAPTALKVNEDGVFSWGSVKEAKSYKAYVKKAGEEEGEYYDLDFYGTTTGMAGTIKDIEDGEYLVTVIATADGYENSEPSAEIEFSNHTGQGIARWTVTLDLGDEEGSTLEVEAINGRKIAAPLTPSREGYTFDGWFEDEYRVFAVDFETYRVTSPTTFYAKWTKIGGDTPDTPDNPDNPNDPDTPDTPDTPDEKCEYHFDADGDGKCDKCGETVPEYEPGGNQSGWDGTLSFDLTGLDHEGEAYVYIWYTDYSENKAWPGEKLEKTGDTYTFVSDNLRTVAGLVVSYQKDGETKWQSVDVTSIPESHVLTKTELTEQSGFEGQGNWNGYIVVDVTALDWFEDEGCVAFLHAWFADGTNNGWPGQEMTGVAPGRYTLELGTEKTLKGLVVTRVSADKTIIHNKTADITSFGDGTIVITEMIEENASIVQQDENWDGKVYVDVSAIVWFEDDGCVPYLYYWYDGGNNGWPGEKMTKGDGGKYTLTIDSAKKILGFIVTRVNAEGTRMYNKTADITALGGDHTITVTAMQAEEQAVETNNGGQQEQGGQQGQQEQGGEQGGQTEQSSFNGDANKYYLIGKINGVEDWNGVSASYVFGDGNNENQAILLNVTLKAGDKLKAVKGNGTDWKGWGAIENNAALSSIDNDGNGIVKEDGVYNVYLSNDGKLYIAKV